MEEQNKYYTPEIEEFHVGFEYERCFTSGTYWYGDLLDTKDQSSLGEWYKAPKQFVHNWNKKEVDINVDLTDIVNCLTEKRTNPDCLIRVKYLDKEDIESLGWVYSKNDYAFANGCLTIDDHIYFDKPNYKLIFSQRRRTVTLFIEDVCKLESEKEFGTWVTLQEFPLKNKSELKKLMQQLNIQ